MCERSRHPRRAVDQAEDRGVVDRGWWPATVLTLIHLWRGRASFDADAQAALPGAEEGRRL